MDIQAKLLEILSDYTDGRITSAKADDVLTSDFGLNSSISVSTRLNCSTSSVSWKRRLTSPSRTASCRS